MQFARNKRHYVPSAAARWIGFVLGLIAALASSPALATEDRLCDGPSVCCPAKIASELQNRVTVALGVVVMGIANINERAGTWDADFYLYERWKPAPGLTPQTEIVNESERHATQFDTTEVRDGECLRGRRIRSTLRANYNLRAFPFDHQSLPLEFSDDQFDSRQLVYAERPYAAGLDDGVRRVALAWKVEEGQNPTVMREQRQFKWDPGAPVYDYATFGVDVRRHVTFHLTKYFLPLLIIVALAFSVFWVDAEDLGSQVTVGVTALLAAIAFQFAEAGTLPEVAYLTLADRVYVVCYVAIALAIFETIYSSSVARRGDKNRALAIDRRCRVIFPAALALALVLAIVRAFTQTTG